MHSWHIGEYEQHRSKINIDGLLDIILRITILDEIEEQNEVAIRWNLKTTHEKDFAGMAASHKKIEIEGTEILHFEKDKIKEGWTIFNMAELAKWW